MWETETDAPNGNTNISVVALVVCIIGTEFAVCKHSWQADGVVANFEATRQARLSTICASRTALPAADGVGCIVDGRGCIVEFEGLLWASHVRLWAGGSVGGGLGGGVVEAIGGAAAKAVFAPIFFLASEATPTIAVDLAKEALGRFFGHAVATQQDEAEDRKDQTRQMESSIGALRHATCSPCFRACRTRSQVQGGLFF